MQYLLHVVLLSLVFSELPLTHTSASYDGKLRNATDGTIEAYMIPPFKSSHASFIEPCPNGDLVMAWFSGSAEGYSDVNNNKILHVPFVLTTVHTCTSLFVSAV